MHLRIFLGHFPSLSPWPHHKRVHRTFDVLVVKRFRWHLDRYSDLRSTIIFDQFLLQIQFLSSIDIILSHLFIDKQFFSSLFLSFIIARWVSILTNIVHCTFLQLSITWPSKLTISTCSTTTRFQSSNHNSNQNSRNKTLLSQTVINFLFQSSYESSSQNLSLFTLTPSNRISKFTRKMFFESDRRSSSHSQRDSFFNVIRICLVKASSLNPLHSICPCSIQLKLVSSRLLIRRETAHRHQVNRREAVWLIPWRGLVRIRQDLSDIESGMSQGGIGTEWSSWSPVGRGGDKDRPTRDVSTLPPWSTANGQARLAPSSTWRTEDTGAFNRWRCASSLFAF